MCAYVWFVQRSRMKNDVHPLDAFTNLVAVGNVGDVRR